MQLMGDKTKFIAFLELHKNKADKIRQGIDKAKALMADQGGRAFHDVFEYGELISMRSSQRTKSLRRGPSWWRSRRPLRRRTSRRTRSNV
jgi:hypothetical protein